MIHYDIKNYYDWPIVPRALLIGFVCMMVFLLAYYLDFSQLRKRVRIDRQQESELKQQLEIVFKKQAELVADLSKQQGLNKTLHELQAKLVNRHQLPEALNEILKIGYANGLQFNLFSPSKEAFEDIYVKLPIKVMVLGTYDQVANFIAQLARMVPLITVGNFAIQKPEKVTPASNAGITHARGFLVSEIILNAYRLNGDKQNENKN